MIIISEHTDFTETKKVKQLFVDYISELEINVGFQNFESELADLSKYYSRQSGGSLWTAQYQGELIGCVALKKLDSATCEMKRLYVRPAFRNKQVGLRLLNSITEAAIQLGYVSMKLDVLKKSTRAIELYKAAGFKETSSYCYNPYPAIWMELHLKNKIL